MLQCWCCIAEMLSSEMLSPGALCDVSWIANSYGLGPIAKHCTTP